MKRKSTCIALALAALLLFAGCGGGNAATAPSAPMAPGAPAAAPSAPTDNWVGESADMDMGWEAPQEPMPAPAEDAAQTESPVYRNSGAKLIRRAELTIQTEQFDQTAAALEALAAQYNGYFESSSEYGGSWRDVNARRSGEYVVRVPSEHYGSFLRSAGDLGYVTNKRETSEDVGEQYYDTEARLKTQRTKQERLLSLLERAETMEDIIQLENALSEVEYQIEQYTSTLNRYDSLIGYSTFTIWLEEVRQVNQEVGETSSLGDRMAAGFAAGTDNLVDGAQNFLVWLSYNLFSLLILAAVVVVVAVAARRVGRRVRRRKQPLDGQEPKEK